MEPTAEPTVQDNGETAARRRTKAVRAPRACLHCRIRKVRCNVCKTGEPQNSEYWMTPTQSLRCPTHPSPQYYQDTSFGWALMMMELTTSALPRRNTGSLNSSPGKDGDPEIIRMLDQTPISSPQPQQPRGQEQHEEVHPREQQRERDLGGSGEFHFPRPGDDNVHNVTDDQATGPSLDARQGGQQQLQQQQQPNTRRRRIPSIVSEHRAVTVVYSYHSFLAVNSLVHVLPQDVNFLESEGCFHLPSRPILDHFVHRYFLHVHPTLPMLNETDFWEAYTCTRHGQEGTGKRTVSLLLVQTILFASCAFVPAESIRLLGYDSTRTARATFYRRAKLLYDFDIESSPVAIARAALLLSYWTPPARADLKPNSTWLSVAVQNARNARADYDSAMARDVLEAPGKESATLSRLWWCCIMRDRILSLGLRRSIQITKTTFDVEKHYSKGCLHLQDEVHRSRLYSPATKQALAGVLVRTVRLCVIMTDVILLAFPPDREVASDGGWSGRPAHALDYKKMRECRASLYAWFEETNGIVYIPSDRNKIALHESVLLYTNLMYIYYHWARVVLCHCQLRSVVSVPKANPDLSQMEILWAKNEIQDASSCISDGLEALNKLRITRCLPLSIVAYAAFPLSLHVLNARLSGTPEKGSSGSSQDSSPADVTKRNQTNPLLEAMKISHPLYDGVDWVAKVVACAVHHTKLETTASGSTSSVTDWKELLTVSPGRYVRLFLAMDLSLSSGKSPDDDDFAASLKNLSGAAEPNWVDLAWESTCSISGVDGELLPPTFPSPTERVLSILRDEGEEKLARDEAGIPQSPISFDTASLSRLEARFAADIPESQVLHSSGTPASPPQENRGLDKTMLSMGSNAIPALFNGDGANRGNLESEISMEDVPGLTPSVSCTSATDQFTDLLGSQDDFYSETLFASYWDGQFSGEITDVPRAGVDCPSLD
ncbi:uncharacterized protein MKZ38_008663 [Zalerion maritima]|uniref:Xylanolytic transcriptional activator regulatory domain-containing protein n=1 Tax=Zalerion maritima TaxID=339359 RepID=A0AAD5RGJ7_9PEZI|nr:uncharacterized protein MKZ38_008663 [Zalerion maritima]